MNRIVAESVRREREERGWTQEQLVKIAKISGRTVQRIEAGAAADVESLRDIAAALETDPKRAPARPPGPSAQPRRRSSVDW